MDSEQVSLPKNKVKPGLVWSFGRNIKGQLGQGTDISTGIEFSFTPGLVEKFLTLNENVISISGGNAHSCAITQAAKFYTWGDGGFGKLGLGDRFIKKDFNTPQILQISGVVQAEAAMAHNILLTDTLECWTWGCGYLGRLGHCDNRHQSYPISVEAISKDNIVFIAAGGSSTAAVNSKGELYTWGFNAEGQCGLGTIHESYAKPQRVSFPMKSVIFQLSCGETHMVALSRDGTVWSWGGNDAGQLGLGVNTEKVLFPEQIMFFKSLGDSVVSISCGKGHNAALTSQGQVYTWGHGADGRLGYFVFKVIQSSPSLVENFEGKCIQVSCGSHHTALVTQDNRLWVFGSNKNGQLGLPPDYQITNPNWDVPGVNKNGREGDGDILHYFRPVRHPKLIGVQRVSCGGYHTLVLISGEDERVIQHTIDGRVDHLKQYAAIIGDTKVRNAIDRSCGRYAIHWATYYNHLDVLKFLISTIRVQVDVQDSESGKTPLHIACERGYTDAATALLTLGRSNAGIQDKLGKTPLFYAVEKKYQSLFGLLFLYGAKLDTKDEEGKTPLDYCSFEESFQLKVLAHKHDIVILYTKKDYNFALKLYSEIERFFIKCWMKGHPSITKNSISDRPVEVMIQDAKGITFICSPESCEDKELIEYLKLVKKLKKGLFPLWLEKITFSPEVEALLYRKQVVDFSDQTKFKECSSSLVAGLRNLFRKIEEGNESDEEDETATNEKKQAKSQDYLFLCYDPQDQATADKLDKTLKARGFSCVHTISGANRHKNSKTILNSRALLFILTAKSVVSSKLRDQIALAENHNKQIFPLLEKDGQTIQLDPAMQYTLAKTPKFILTDSGIDQLLYILKITERVISMQDNQKELEKQYAELEQQLIQQKKMLGIIKDTTNP